MLFISSLRRWLPLTFTFMVDTEEAKVPGGGSAGTSDSTLGKSLSALGTAQYMPYPLEDLAGGMRFEMQSWLELTEDTELPEAQGFYNGVRTRIMDDATCVYYSEFGAVVRDESLVTHPERQCNTDTPLWLNSNGIPVDTDKMDVYLSKEKIGINKIDFEDSTGNSKFSTTCTLQDAASDSMLQFTLTKNDPIQLYFVLADDYEVSSLDNKDMTWWMLQTVKVKDAQLPPTKVFGHHPYHIGAIRIDLHHDPDHVTFVGFQPGTDNFYPDRGAAFAGFYYKIKNCQPCDLTNALNGLTIVTDTLQSPTLIYNMEFSLNVGVDCLKFKPEDSSVTHDYSDKEALTAQVQLKTLGNYRDLKLIVTNNGIPTGTLINFTYHFGYAILSTKQTKIVLTLQFITCSKDSIAWSGTLGQDTIRKVYGDLLGPQQLTLPTYAIDINLPQCWDLTYDFIETTAGSNTVQSQLGNIGAALDSGSTPPVTVTFVELPTNLNIGTYSFKYRVQDIAGTKIVQKFQIEVYCLKTSITWVSAAVQNKYEYAFGEAVPGSQKPLPNHSIDISQAPCWDLTYTLSETTVGETMETQLGYRAITIDTSTSEPAHFNFVAWTNSLNPGTYTFTYEVKDSSTTISAQWNLEIEIICLRDSISVASISPNPHIVKEGSPAELIPFPQVDLLNTIEESPCWSLAYSIEESGSTTGLLLSAQLGDTIKFDDAIKPTQLKIPALLVDKVKAGTYSFKLTVKDQNDVAVQPAIVVFNLQILSKCDFPTSLQANSSPLSTQEYVVSSAQQKFIILEFDGEPSDCPITYSYQLSTSDTKLASVVTFNAQQRYFNFFSADVPQVSALTEEPFTLDIMITVKATLAQLSEEQSFTLRLKHPCVDKRKVDLSAPDPCIVTSQVSISVPNPQTEKSQVEIRVSDPCTDTSQVKISVPGPIEVFYAVGQGLFDLSILNNVDLQPSLCGEVKARLANDTEQFDFITYDNDADILQIETENKALVDSMIQVELVPYLVSYDGIIGDPILVLIFLENCKPGSISPSFIPMITIQLDSQPESVNLPRLAVENDHTCEIEWSCTLELIKAENGGDPKDYFTFDQQTFELYVDPQEAAQVDSFFMLLVCIARDREDIIHKIPLNIVFTAEKKLQQQGVILDKSQNIIPIISSVDLTGSVKIFFGVEMITVQEGRVLAGTKLEAGINLDELRLQGTQIQDESKLIPSSVYDAISVYVDLQGSGNQDMLNFTWQIDKYSDDEMSIQLDFKNKDYVSQGKEPDVLVIRLNNPSVFQDKNGRKVEEGTEIRKVLQTQASADMKLAVESVGMAATASVGVNLAINVIMQVQMTSLASSLQFDMVKKLQIIVHMVMFRTILPNNTQILFAQLIGILTFDPIDISEEVAKVYYIDDITVKNERFESLDYASPYFIVNLGSVNIIVALSVVVFALFGILAMLPASKCEKCRKSGRRQVQKSCCNRLISFLDGSLIVWLVGALLNVHQVRQGNAIANSSLYMSIITLIVCAGYFICIIVLATCYRTRHEDPKIKLHFGSTFEDLKTKRTFWVLAHPISSIARIWIFCISIIFMQTYLISQFLILMLCSVVYLATLSIRPYKNSTQFTFELLGEATVLGVLDCLVISSDPVIDPRGRQRLGEYIIAMVISLVVITQIYVLFIQICSIRLMCLKWRYNKRIIQIMHERAEKAKNNTKVSAEGSQVSSSERRSRHRRTRIEISKKQSEESEDSNDSSMESYDDEEEEKEKKQFEEEKKIEASSPAFGHIIPFEANQDQQLHSEQKSGAAIESISKTPKQVELCSTCKTLGHQCLICQLAHSDDIDGSMLLNDKRPSTQLDQCLTTHEEVQSRNGQLAPRRGHQVIKPKLFLSEVMRADEFWGEF